MITVEGKGGIRAAVVADSINDHGNRITTFEVEFHRLILSENNTHRAHSRNAASSRAIPIMKQLKQISDYPAMPIYYGANIPGMSANDELSDNLKNEAIEIINFMRRTCVYGVKRLNEIGLHKQTANRYIEPWQMVKGVITATEFDNFFYLRKDAGAQPEINELATVMWSAMKSSEPELLNPGEWHTPYVNHCCGPDETIYYYVVDDFGNDVHMDVKAALKVSASCCAQVSYRLTDNSVDKAIDIYDKLVNSKPVHASPFEHQATPMGYQDHGRGWDWDDGVTHMDRSGEHWSGNLKGWIQHRQLIPDNTCWDYST